MVALSKLTHDRRVQAPSLGSAPDGQQSMKLIPEARHRIEDCNVRSIATAAAFALNAGSDVAITTEVAREKKAKGRSGLRSMMVKMVMMDDGRFNEA